MLPGKRPLSGGCLEHRAAEFGSGPHASFGKPALVDLQDEAHRPRGAVRNGRLGLHIFKIHDGAIPGYKGCRQGYQGIFHPKTLLAGGLEFKKHAFLLWHFRSKHQTDGVLLRSSRHLSLNLMDARRKGYAR